MGFTAWNTRLSLVRVEYDDGKGGRQVKDCKSGGESRRLYEKLMNEGKNPKIIKVVR